ncbi:hypothetical protein BRC2024_PQPTKSFJ_CDS_0262 [Tegunavirus sp. BRC001]
MLKLFLIFVENNVKVHLLVIDAIKAMQNDAKAELKRVDVRIDKIRRDMYKERRWRIRNNRPVGLADKTREKEVQQAKEALEATACMLRRHIRDYGDTICRIREIRRGNSKKNIHTIVENLFTSL